MLSPVLRQALQRGVVFYHPNLHTSEEKKHYYYLGRNSRPQPDLFGQSRRENQLTALTTGSDREESGDLLPAHTNGFGSSFCAFMR